MKRTSLATALLFCAALVSGSIWLGCTQAPEKPPEKPAPAPIAVVPAPERHDAEEPARREPAPPANVNLPEPGPIAPFMSKGIEWLVAAQHEDGGWGGGSHADQQSRDPKVVKTDPATTALAAMALLRAGHTPVEGKHKAAVARATEHLVAVVEKADAEGPQVTTLTNTQPQVKLGPWIDTSLCAQFLTRVEPHVASLPELSKRVHAAVEKCLRKLEKSQKKDGSWNSGGWAPALQTAMAGSALDDGARAGFVVDKAVLDRTREYQQTRLDERSGRAEAGDAAGVELYAYSANQRSNARGAADAKRVVEQAKAEGRLEKDAPVDAATLVRAGLPTAEATVAARAYTQTEINGRRLEDETLLAGFGNNGGEEFLSFMLTTDSLVVTGGEKFAKWKAKLHERLAKVQNGDGSWSGHHCITSPVFCTAAAMLSLTADRDARQLAASAGKRS